MLLLCAVVLAIASVASAQSCGVQTTQPSVGVADATVFPWVGLIYYQKGDGTPTVSAMCTLIDKQHVLVPAYITSPSVRKNLKYVQFGATDLKDTASTVNYTIDKILTHSESDKNGSSDEKIAIIMLEEPVRLSDNVSPVCLPEKDQNYEADNYHFVSYNIENTPGHAEFKDKKHVSLLPRVNASDCQKSYTKQRVTSGPVESGLFICAGDKDNDSCRGDAGSPLLSMTSAGWTAVGLSYYGPTVCKTGIPSLFLSIQPYLEWIRTVLAS